jgi:hypothetical protein
MPSEQIPSAGVDLPAPERKSLHEAEREIDAAFAENALAAVPWTQSTWTMLSALEDHHFKIMVVEKLPDREAAIYVDGLMNALTHPLRVLFRSAPKAPSQLSRRFIDEHYGLAMQWIDAAEDYNHFCSVFPLFHAGEISLQISGDWIQPTDWSTVNLSYEVYDRFVGKREPEAERRLNSDAIAATLRTCIRTSGGMFSIEFTRRLVDELKRNFSPSFEGRHVLPPDWEFSKFSLAQYRSVFVLLQVLCEAWFVARQLVALTGARGMGYEASVWTPRKMKLVSLIKRHTGICTQTIEDILRYLTFGEVGVRNPDIAIQPLVDLGDGHFAIAPFLLLHGHAERNLCVLLNQVAEDRRLYARLVEEKEQRIRGETIDSLRDFGFDFRYGALDNTDVDLAVIDHRSKTCLCIELKWFIEPAEVREVLMRSEEVSKGISQARLLTDLFKAEDERLLSLLGVDSNYDFLAMVGSVNFIGRAGIQDPDIPVTKVWHLISEIQRNGSLSETLGWLRSRRYLPVKDRDFKVHTVPIESGRWKSHWYAISHA